MLLAGTMLASTAAAPAVRAQQAIALPPVAVEGQGDRSLETTTQINQSRIDQEAPTTLKDLFQGEPAVTVPAGGVATQRIYLHGLDQSKIDVRIDGAPQNNTVWHHNGSLAIDPIFLKAATVAAGVAPADTGFGALGGAVQFTTKDAGDLLKAGRDLGAMAITSYDSNARTWRGTGAGYAAVEGFEVLGIGTRARGNDYKDGNGRKVEGTTPNMISGLAKLAYEAKEGHRVAVSGEIYQDDAIRRLRPNMGVVANPTGSLLNANTIERKTATLSYRTTAPTSLFDPDLRAYYSNETLKRPNDNNRTTAHGAFNSEIETVGGTLANRFAIPMGTLSLGFDGYKSKVKIDRFHFSTDAKEVIAGYGAFAQARVAPIGGVRLSAGLRVDRQHYDTVDGQGLSNTGASPNISGEVDLWSDITAFAGYGYVWGGIDRGEPALFHAGNYRYSSEVDPTTAHNTRAGLRFERGGVKLEGAVFFTLIDNPADYDYARLVRVDGNNLKSQGIELSAAYRWEVGNVYGKFVHTDVRYGDRIALPNDSNMGIAPGSILTFGGEYTLPDLRLTFAASGEIALKIEDSGLAANGFRALDQYEVVNLSAQWQPFAETLDWILRAEANNVLEEEYSSRATFTQTSNIMPVLSPGRSFLLTSTVRF